MSRKRYISTELSTDTKIADLADCGLLAPLLFTWAIPHMDDWGRITGNAREFKLLVCPGLNISNSDVDEAINHIVKAKLWRRYEQDGKLCIAVMNQDNWFKHQSYIGKDKRLDDSKSSFHSPPQNAEEHRETPQNTEKGRGIPQNPSSLSFSSSVSFSSSDSITNGGDHSYQNVFGVYQREIGDTSDIIREKLCDLELTYTEEWVKRAIKTAVLAAIKKMSYIEGTLRKWKATGHDEPWTLEKAEQPKSNVRNFNRSSTGTSGKKSIPINHNPATSVPLSNERREALLAKAAMLDGSRQ